MAAPKTVNGRLGPANIPSESDKNRPGSRITRESLYRIHQHLSFWITSGANDIGKKLFGTHVPMQNMIFSPFFIIQDKLHHDTCLPGGQVGMRGFPE
ncbi:hypothetical protein BG74_03540 [Sodalis-like endosymbiont of Proechinophthirus fluctus]|nr:hypothetical protein BG74_03540 [Sodalis-like endosymbiont of Proechinophthirus fluctus]